MTYVCNCVLESLHAECVGDLSCIQISCAAVFVSLNNGSIVSFCFTKISWLELRLKFKSVWQRNRPCMQGKLSSLDP